MRNNLLFLSLLAIASFLGTALRADEFSDHSIPNKWIEPLLPEQLPKLKYPEFYTDLDKAKLEAFTGRYKLSLITLAKAKNPDPLEAALVKGLSLSAIGKKTQAIAALSDSKVAGRPRAMILRARIHAELGELPRAIELAKEVCKLKPDSAAGHYYLGEFSETIGDIDAARAAYAYFEPYTDKLLADPIENPEELTFIGHGLDRWATLNSKYKEKDSLNNLILSKTFVQVYQRVDREYWPAMLAAAEFHLARDDQKTTGELLKQALRLNPNSIRAAELLGKVQLSQFNFDACEKAIASIRKIDPNAIEAELLEIRNLLQQRRPSDAHRIVQRVLARQPKNLEILGLQAAVYALQLKEAEMDAVLKQVESIDPDNATAYLEVAEQLAAMRQYPRAAKKFEVAVQRAPWWTSAYNGLGLLHTQSGDEKEAYRVLQIAKLLDHFNYATHNYLALLDMLNKYEKKETEHFVIMYDAKKDPMIPEYFGAYLESIYKDVCGMFHHEPAVKTYIEIFPTHDAFSVRTTGSPWIGTVGASTGRVIAMVSPRKGKFTMGVYNWAQVLRHEFTHTVTLSATDNRIAHWMTEGLAVYEEHSPLRWEWVPMLYNAVKNKQLFTMENITWGFVRPKKPTDRSLAYAQSYWICQYIIETYGHDKMLAMLDEFRLGKEQNVVFPKLLNKNLAEFQKDFVAWAEKQVSTWGYDAATSQKYKDLREKGEALIKGRKYAEALPIWQQIVKIRPMDALPYQRLAGLYRTKEINQPAKAVEYLERLHKVDLYDNRWAKLVSRTHRDANTMDKALHFALQAVYIDPYDVDAHELLAELHEKAGDKAGAEREKKMLKILEDFTKSTPKEGARATTPN